jgi:hypothetical protein
MAVSYGAPSHRRGQQYTSKALGTVKALQEHFEGEGVNIFSEAALDVMSNKVAFNEYVERLVEGTDEQTRQDLIMLAENVRMGTLTESTIAGANPITALSLPILRVGFPKIAVREGLPTEPVEQPKFKITTKRPYIVDHATNEKVYLPGAMTARRDLFGLPQLNADVPVTGGAVSGFDLLTPISKNAALGDEIDGNFAVTSVTVDGVVFPVEFKLDTNINVIQGQVTVPAVGGATPVPEHTATFLAKVNREKGLIDATAIGGVLSDFKIRGYVSSEANNAALQVGFDIDAIELVVGTAQPVESPINIQQITDVMAMYQIDSTLAHLESMSTVIAHATDLQGIDFLKRSFQQSAGITEAFDVVPPSNYALGDAAWREQIKIKFDRLVTKLQTSVNIYSGHAVIFAHPLDAQVVSNVRWVYNNDEQPNDVSVDYKVGTFTSGITTYTLLQSPYFTQGEFIVIYVPSEPDFTTFKYYPYSFLTVRGSASPNTVNLPSIQMIKRHLFNMVTPMIGKVTIANNA